jgi:hypothetical protein
MEDLSSHPAPTTRLLQKDEIRLCANPLCGLLFKAASKYNPGQKYCGGCECNRIRHNLRQWKLRHPELFAQRQSLRDARRPTAVYAGSGLLWLVAGIMGEELGIRTEAELYTAAERLAAKGRRLCGNDGGLALLRKIIVTDAMREK